MIKILLYYENTLEESALLKLLTAMLPISDFGFLQWKLNVHFFFCQYIRSRTDPQGGNNERVQFEVSGIAENRASI
jgi:hypothetical protein